MMAASFRAADFVPIFETDNVYLQPHPVSGSFPQELSNQLINGLNLSHLPSSSTAYFDLLLVIHAKHGRIQNTRSAWITSMMDLPQFHQWGVAVGWVALGCFRQFHLLLNCNTLLRPFTFGLINQVSPKGWKGIFSFYHYSISFTVCCHSWTPQFSYLFVSISHPVLELNAPVARADEQPTVPAWRWQWLHSK